MGKLDFKAINAVALSRLPGLLAEWLPDGKAKGKEYFARNPMRDDRSANSFSVNLHTGQWYDFASDDKGGDVIALYAFIYCGGDNGEAAKQLAERFGTAPLPAPAKPAKPAPDAWVNAPVPADPPKPPAAHFIRGKPAEIYPYLTAVGKPLGYVYRFTKSDGSKETIPLAWCQHRKTGQESWHWRAFAEPRPLYGLDRLALRPKALVMVVEGEKCADAGTRALWDCAWLSWAGGGKAVDKTDWTPLKGKSVGLWADCDGLRENLSKADKAAGVDPESKPFLPEDMQPGVVAMRKVAGTLLALGCKVYWLNIPPPGTKPSGWDVADAIADGLRGAALAAYIKDNSIPYAPKNAAPVAPPARGVQPTAKKRQELVEVIEKTEDFDALTGAVVQLVLSAGLTPPAKEQLLSKIAKKAGVSRQSLTAKSGGGDSGDGDPDTDERIQELNTRHAIVRMAGRVLILNRDYDPALKKNYFTFSGRHDFELLYWNQTVYRRGEPKGIGEVWLKHPARLQYEGITFQPGGTSNGFLNMWQGWGVEPGAGSCHKILEFISSTICSGDEALYSYILNWCAHLVQRPQELPETALVLRGKEGAGKNRFANVLGQIVGLEHYLLLTSMGQVSGRFSGHLANALLVFCNEAVWGGDKAAQGVLKSMITDEVQPVEYKGRDISMVPNFKRLLMASNEDWVVPRGANDRHYVIIDVDDGQIGKFDYWKALQAEIDNGGAAAFMRHLLDIDIEGWHPRIKPDKIMQRGWDLKIRGAGSVVQWWFDVLQQGWLIHDTGEYSGKEQFTWPERILKNTARDIYTAWATRQQVAHIEHSTVIGTQLKRWGITDDRDKVEGFIVPQRFYVLPELAEAKQHFSKAFDIPSNVLS